MTYETPFDTPYEDIARDAMDGKRVAVFCDGANQLKMCKNGIAGAAKRLGANKVVYPLRDKRITIDGNSVRLFITNGLSHRGNDADVVYLSEDARMQLEFANLCEAEVK